MTGREADRWALLLVAMLSLVSTARLGYGRELYPGQYAQYSPQERAWFKAVRSPSGVPCCDIADGHKTTWKHGESETGYVVAVDDRDDPSGTAWVPVPQRALIINTSDPEGDTVVWYVEQEGHTDETGQRHHSFYIRCFVAGTGG